VRRSYPEICNVISAGRDAIYAQDQSPLRCGRTIEKSFGVGE
jgi:hypothetical protein